MLHRINPNCPSFPNDVVRVSAKLSSTTTNSSRRLELRPTTRPRLSGPPSPLTSRASEFSVSYVIFLTTACLALTGGNAPRQRPERFYQTPVSSSRISSSRRPSFIKPRTNFCRVPRFSRSYHGWPPSCSQQCLPAYC